MGFQKDQSFTGETYRPVSPIPNGPPPLPPRAAAPSPYSQPPPSYEAAMSGYHSQPLSKSWSAQDPRSSSTDSLVPRENRGKRTLLLIFIHGFLGNESSFQSFPAHIHNLLTSLLSETHVVHTKIYPRYKSRKAIEYARDDFSNWLCPHESPETDVVLLGHSMGGILAAEVALLTPYSSTSRERFRHRILGTINFDTPFLGMHPGVIVSGIGSLFKPAPAPAKLKERREFRDQDVARPMPSSIEPGVDATGDSSGYFGSTSDVTLLDSNASTQISRQDNLSPLGTPANDPNFDPPFQNDIRLPVRKGWDNTLHFIMKHSDGLTQATKSYVTSHLEFGGCLADYPGLKNRYTKIRELEDVNERQDNFDPLAVPLKRVRFVNYYTASTGRIPKDKPPPGVKKSDKQRQPSVVSSDMCEEMQNLSLVPTESQSLPNISDESSRQPQDIDNPISRAISISVQHEATETAVDEEALSDANQEMSHVEPGPFTDESDPEHEESAASNADRTAESGRTILSPEHDDTAKRSSSLQLPPVPPSPTTPLPFDPSPYTNKDERKIAEKEHSRQMKAFQRAVKDRDKTIKERRKLVEKREKEERQGREKRLKEQEKLRVKEEKEAMKQSNETDSHTDKSITPSTVDENGELPPQTSKPKRDKKFCMLPLTLSNGERDLCWPRVFMENVDEVGAHCGLFFAENPHYETLVGDVGERIESWIREAGRVRRPS